MQVKVLIPSTHVPPLKQELVIPRTETDSQNMPGDPPGTWQPLSGKPLLLILPKQSQIIDSRKSINNAKVATKPRNVYLQAGIINAVTCRSLNYAK